MTKTVQITLPDDVEAALLAAISSGEFASMDDIVLHAAESWRADRMVENIGVEKLRRLWDEGIASGPGEGLSVEEILARAGLPSRN